MTGQARQSYYEIALTNRQVLTVFVVLLLAVLAAFLSGVWVGRRGSAPQVETVEARAIEAAAAPGDEPLERLDFFSRNGPPADKTPPSAGQPEAVSEPGAPAASPPEATPPPASPEPAVREPTRARPPAEKPKAATPEPAPAKPAPAKPAPAKPAPAKPAPAKPASSGLVVQVFSSNNQVQAQGIVDQLRSGGYPALLSPVEVLGRTMYRVRIGPYQDRQVAEGIAEQVRRDFRLETWITE